jgi:Polyketide cyclase / dehydrase and lipid transport
VKPGARGDRLDSLAGAPRPRSLAVTTTVLVRRPVDTVWDFTQDLAQRPEWDASVLEATVLEREPLPRVRVRCAGGLRCLFRYRSFDRAPVRPSARSRRAFEHCRLPRGPPLSRHRGHVKTTTRSRDCESFF